MRRRTRLWITGLLLSVIAGGGYCVYRMVETASEAEFNMHAELAVISAIRAHLAQHGRMPQSWAELETTTATTDGMFAWPRDEQAIRAHLDVDFAACAQAGNRTDLQQGFAVRGTAYDITAELDGLMREMLEKRR